MKPFHYKIIQRNSIYITAAASSGGPFSRTNGFGQRLKINGSQLKNPDISGALHTLRIQYLYTQTQCEDGARDVRVLKLTPVTF